MATSVPYRNSRLLRAILCATLLAVGFSVSSCKKNSGQPPASASGPHLKWNVRTLTSGVSHPAIGRDGTIYVGTSGGAEAFDPAGKMLWKVTYASPGAPVIAEDGTLYFESHQGLVLGISSDGQLVWQPKLGLIGFKAPPALGPDTSLFYVNTASDLWAFQPKRSDRESWSLSTFREGSLDSATILPGTARVGGAAQNGAPIVYGDSTVLLPRQNFLHAFSTNGSSYWRNELSPGDLGMAAIGRDGTIYVGDDRSILYAVDPSGATKWRFDLSSSVHGSPVVDADGVIYCTDGVAVYAINPDGSLKWRYYKPKEPYFVTPPTLAANGTLYIGAEFGLLAFAPDGILKWKTRVMSPTSPITIAPDGTLYFGCGYSWLCSFEAEGSPLMQSSWPKPYHDIRNTSRYSGMNE